MLTVDYDRLGLRAGDRVLDLGCGFGRHAYEALRRGARVVACDLGADELRQVRAIAAGMADAGELPGGERVEQVATAVRGDGTRLPFADDSFDRVMASEVLEHIPDDLSAFHELARVLRPGGTLAITVPAWLPERLCWALSDDYHAPAVTGGHVRIYSVAELRAKLQMAGLDPTQSHRTHALHSPYWWIRCVAGPNQPIDDNAAVRTYHKLLVWDIMKHPRTTRLAERFLNPVLGKSLVVYATKPAPTRPPAAARELSHAHA